MKIGRFEVNNIVVGDCGNHLHDLPDESVTAVLCDPPYGLAFMGKGWDSFKDNVEYQAWVKGWTKELLRACVSGAVGLFFGGTRTFHRLACGLEDAGWEVYDTLMWMYGSGFPKSHNVSKAIDKAAGAEREVVGKRITGKAGTRADRRNADEGFESGQMMIPVTAPATDLAKAWDGYGTALKPAWEPIILARKPRGKTYRECAVEGGAGALNIDGSRIQAASNDRFGGGGLNSSGQGFMADSEHTYQKGTGFRDDTAKGRWPANVILSHHPDCVRVGVKRVKGTPRSYVRASDSENQNAYGKGIGESKGKLSLNYADPDGLETIEAWECVEGCPVRQLDEMSGDCGGRWGKPNPGKKWFEQGDFGCGLDKQAEYIGDTKGGASRFFYCAKASRGEREAGLLGVIPCHKCSGLDTEHHFERRMGKDWVIMSRVEATSLPLRKEFKQRKKGGEFPDVRDVTCIRNPHPTVKPLDLTEYLVRLIRPPEAYLDDAVLLVPFAGTGSEIIGAIKAGWQNWLGIEISGEYTEIARARIAYWQAEIEADRQKRVQMEMEL